MAYNNKKEISVTEALSDCPRIWQYHYEIQNGLLEFSINEKRNGFNEVRPPGIHMYQARGSVAHLALDRYVNGLETSWTWADFMKYDSIGDEQTFPGLKPSMFNYIKLYAEKCYIRGMNFIDNSTIIDFSNVETEKRMKYKISDDCILTGKPDIISNDMVLDWKTGKESFMTKSKYAMQLAGYDFLYMMENGHSPDKWLTVYLGGGTAQPVGTPEVDMATITNKFMDKLELAIVKKNDAYEGKHMPCKTSFLCGMCEFAGLCRGV